MRPVLLEMAGFGSFREPTTVDFTAAEYFALIGPTGSGKSTVIDAITFALYGSVPRWDNARTVALALAPTVARGTVRFVFDVTGRAGGTERYVVARELRRAASGGVSVRTARLERLRDPAGTGAVAEETEPVADGAPATTKAVEALLGLPFGDFTTCVVLPQGEFAEFLHTEPRKRQETLVRLLGLGVYDVIAKEANAEARSQEQRAQVLTEQLGDYVDDTQAAEQAAAERITALAAVRARVDAATPALTVAAAELAEAEATVGRLSAERSRLSGLTPPAGLDELATRRASSAGALAAARDTLGAAEADDTAAREAVRAAPARGPMEQARRHHAERAGIAAELPGARERQAKARASEATAGSDAASARAALDQARATRESAAAALAEAREVGSRLAAERDALRAVVAPAGLDALEGRRARAVDRARSGNGRAGCCGARGCRRAEHARRRARPGPAGAGEARPPRARRRPRRLPRRRGRRPTPPGPPSRRRAPGSSRQARTSSTPGLCGRWLCGLISPPRYGRTWSWGRNARSARSRWPCCPRRSRRAIWPRRTARSPPPKPPSTRPGARRQRRPPSTRGPSPRSRRPPTRSSD